MASSGRPLPTLARRSQSRQKSTFKCDEDLARKLHEEEKSYLLNADQIYAENLQAKFNEIRFNSDRNTAEVCQQQDLVETESKGIALAHELSDRELAYHLQQREDELLANDLATKREEKAEQNSVRGDGGCTVRLRGQDFTGLSPQRTTRSERNSPLQEEEVTEEVRNVCLDEHGTMYIPEELVPYFHDRSDSNIPGALHPAILGMRPHFSEDQWSAIQVNPLEFLLQMTNTSTPDMLPFTEDFDGDSYEALWELAERIGDAQSRGMSSEDIASLPTSTYRAPRSPNSGATRGNSSPGGNEEGDCKVCLDGFEPGQTLRTLPCCHQFHVQCIDEWIKRNAMCPVCRLGLKENLHNTQAQ